MPFGSLSVSNTSIPQYAPPYPVDGSDYTNGTVLTVTYQTSFQCVRHLVPDMLELEDEPQSNTTAIRLTTSFHSYWTMTRQFYVVAKQFGFPKKLGNVALVLKTGSTIVHGYVERPAGQKIVEVGFQPEQKLKGTVESTIQGLNLRVIPSVVSDQRPSVKELVPVDISMDASEVWQGSGSICFPEPSRFDPMHEVKVIRYGTANLLRNASLAIRLPTKVFQL
ncbi:hypothetical protein N7450_011862 [Penicillium hetheringtonii]|uniref:Uncharacterized protein n=1 Tax=Penicillium hetheringtonii TaxID=911720 RepID=A0AAD6GLC9_9EURO|nr:hypothetical protein N7450_011862 [Penicillium hetheringtonii]